MNHRSNSRPRTVADPQALSPFRGEISERLQATALEQRRKDFQLPFARPTLWRRLMYFLRIIGL